MGEIIKFLHLSDIHMLKNYAGNIMNSVINGGGIDPAKILRKILSDTEQYKDIDFIIITGDLVHEGSRSDYALFREIIQGRGLRVPVFLTLGNHDNVQAFWEGYMGQTSAEWEYYYTADIKGLRIIALDSNIGKGAQGEISDRQLNWLKELLYTKAPKGSILLLHHPAVVGVTEDSIYYCLKNAKELHSVIEGGDVLAIFSGHKHRNSVTMLGRIPQFTADSLGYGAIFDEHYMYITDRHGFNYCVIEDGHLYVTNKHFPDNTKIMATVSMTELLEEYLQRKGNV